MDVLHAVNVNQGKEMIKMQKIITAHDVLSQPSRLTEEELKKIHRNAKKLFAEALASAQKIIAVVKKEVKNEIRGGQK